MTGESKCLWAIPPEQVFQAPLKRSHRVSHAQVSHDGQFCLIETTDDNHNPHIYLWSPAGNRFAHLTSDLSARGAMAFSPNSKHVAVATSKYQDGEMQNSLQLWKTDDISSAGAWEIGPPMSLCWSHVDILLVAAGNFVEAWDVSQEAYLWRHALPSSQYANGLCSSQDGRWIAIKTPARVKILDANDESEVWSTDYPIANGGMEFGSESGILYTSDAGNALHLWNAKTGSRTRRIVFPSGQYEAGFVVDDTESTLIYPRAGLERFNGVGLMSLQTGQEHQRVVADCDVRCVALRENKLLIFGAEGSLHVHAVENRIDTSLPNATPVAIDRVAPLKLNFPPSRLHSRGYTLDFTAIEAFQKTAKTAVRLHPRRAREPLPAHVSKIGGATDLLDRLGGGILWPADEAWPVCEHDGRTLIPILQLRKHDFPEMDFLPGRDVFQLLWCPERHDDFGWGPAAQVFWRAGHDIKEVAQPMDLLEIVTAENEMLVPFECELHPERVVEFGAGENMTSDQSKILQQLESDSSEPVDY